MARALELISNALPLTYAYDALTRVTAAEDLGGRWVADVSVIVGVILVACLVLGAATLRRRTP